MTESFSPGICECKINGKWVEYDAACGWSLEESKKAHPNMIYIGSGTELRIDGIVKSGKEILHCFKHK